MGKIDFKPGNMLYPLPAVLVTVRDRAGQDNVFTVAWAGTVCTNPPMLSISVRPERFSYEAIRQTGEFVVNLTTEDMVRAVDYCGVRSGRDHDKFLETGLEKDQAVKVKAASLKDSPVNIECRVSQELALGSHHMFLADVVHVTVDERYMDQKGSFHLDRTRPLVYSHGGYFAQGDQLGSFGFSVRKKKTCQAGPAAAGKKNPGKKPPEKKSPEKKNPEKKSPGKKFPGKRTSGPGSRPDRSAATSSGRQSGGRPGTGRKRPASGSGKYRKKGY